MVNHMQREQRRAPRFGFSATARVIDASGAALDAEVTRISVCGCQLRMKRSLPAGARIEVKISTATDSFQAQAAVVYATAGETGVMFTNVGPAFLPVLQKWVMGAASEGETLV